jgi:hypothetical protein
MEILEIASTVVEIGVEKLSRSVDFCTPKTPDSRSGILERIQYCE